MITFKKEITKALIRLPRCAGWSMLLLFANLVLFHFINLTQVHNFLVSAQDNITFRRLSVFIVRFTGFLQDLMQIMKRFVQSYWLVKWLWYRVYNQKVVSWSPPVLFFYLYLIRLISFIIDVPQPLMNEILDHSISKGWGVTRKMSQSFPNIFRDSRENIVQYYSQSKWVKIIHYTCCLNLSSVEKRLKKSIQQVLALRQSRVFFKYLRLL